MGSQLHEKELIPTTPDEEAKSATEYDFLSHFKVGESRMRHTYGMDYTRPGFLSWLQQSPPDSCSLCPDMIKQCFPFGSSLCNLPVQLPGKCVVMGLCRLC